MDLETFLIPTAYFNWTVPILSNHQTSTSRELTESYPRCVFQKRKENPPSQPSHDDNDAVNNNNNNTSTITPSTSTSTSTTICHYNRMGFLGSYKHPFGVIWHTIFRPSALVQQALDETYHELNLTPGHYHAIHCRVRHPAHHNKDKYQSPADKEADKNGVLLFEGKTKSKALQTAIHAIQCSQWLTTNHQNDLGRMPTYFYSDSPDLVQAVVDSQKQPITAQQNSSSSSHLQLQQRLGPLAIASQIVTRHPNNNNNRSMMVIAHVAAAAVNSNVNFTAWDYAHTFVDLYLAANAKCVSMGVGRFSYMSAKISGTTCWIRHETPENKAVSERWGMAHMSQEVPKCPSMIMATTQE
jgi:hypothetical protein